MTKQQHAKLAEHFDRMVELSVNYPDAQAKYKELAEYNRKQARS